MWDNLMCCNGFHITEVGDLLDPVIPVTALHLVALSFINDCSAKTVFVAVPILIVRLNIHSLTDKSVCLNVIVSALKNKHTSGTT